MRDPFHARGPAPLEGRGLKPGAESACVCCGIIVNRSPLFRGDRRVRHSNLHNDIPPGAQGDERFDVDVLAGGEIGLAALEDDRHDRLQFH